MAKSTKPSSKTSAQTDAPAVVEDAVILPDEDETAKELAKELGPTDETDTDEIQPESLEGESDPQEEGDQSLDLTEGEEPTEPYAENVSATPETTEPPVAAAVPVAPPQVTVQKVGFLPTLGGGIIAAGLGYFAATQGIGQNTEDLTPVLDAQSARIEALDTVIAGLPEPVEMPEIPDLAPLEASVTALREEATTQFASLGEQLSAFDERLTAVERTPTEGGGVSETAISSFERELEGLRTEIAAQETRIQEMADQAAADLAAAQAQTAAIEAEAQAAAEAARAEAEAAIAAAAVAQVRVAMDSGEPFEAALADLEAVGIEVPDAIAAVAADGLPTEADLTAQFPALARQALATARSEGVGQEEGGGMGAFLRNQFNVRSVEPREGDDPDAVLSRAEAALRSGDLDTTLTEVSALPETVRAGFADWLAAAEARKAALAAVASLAPANEN